MRASDLLALTFDPDSGVAVLEAKGEYRFCILGSGIPKSGAKGEVTIQSFTVDPNSLGKKVIAVVVGNFPFLIPVDYKKENRPINLNEPWIGVNRSAWIEKYVDKSNPHKYIWTIEVKVGDETFTTMPNIPGKRYIPDPDFFCRFLAGKVNVTEFIAAAEKAEEELSEIEKLREELQEATEECSIAWQELDAIRKEFEETKKTLENTQKKLRKKSQQAQEIRTSIYYYFNNSLCSWFRWIFRRALIPAEIEKACDKI